MVRPHGALRTAFLVVALASSAAANGRYPLAQQLLVDPSNPDRWWMRATYGLLVSADAGQTWDWICELAIGYGDQEDSVLAADADGRLFVGTSSGLVTSSGGCSWVTNAEVGAGVVDLSMEHDGRHLLVLTDTRAGDGGADLDNEIAVLRSDEATAHFSRLGDPIARSALALTVDAAPSDAKHLYATVAPYPKPGTDAGVPAALLVRSSDGGASWTSVPIPGTSYARQPFIAAVHPTRPDTLYVRVRGESRQDTTIESVALYSEDAGDTWREILRGSADMFGFALFPDGDGVVVGFGDAHAPSGSRRTDPAAVGVYRASAPAFAFEKVQSGEIGCLTRGAPGLFVCANHETANYELGVSSDEGATVSPVFDLGQVRGVFACPDDTEVGRLCPVQWTYNCAIGTCPAPADAGPPVTPPKAQPRDDGCGCRVTTAASPSRALAALAFTSLAAVARVLRRRRVR